MPRCPSAKVTVRSRKREEAWSIPYLEVRTVSRSKRRLQNVQCRFAVSAASNAAVWAAVSFQAEPLSPYDRSRHRPKCRARKYSGAAR